MTGRKAAEAVSVDLFGRTFGGEVKERAGQSKAGLFLATHL